MNATAVTISECLATQKHILWQMLQLHLHDLSEHIPLEDHRYGELSADGLFEFRYFYQYWNKENFPQSKAFFIKLDNTIIGFIMINGFCIAPFEKDTEWNMGEFFILRKFRGYGFASQAAELIFKEIEESWTIGVIKENEKVCHFWERVFQNMKLKDISKQAHYDKWAAVYRVSIA